jgi:restriction system protein
MKLEMAKDSLFAILLRKPWWVSIAIAAALAVVARLLLPEKYAIAGALGIFPFVVVGAIALWRQLRAPGTAHVASTLEAIGAMSWRDFAAALEAAFRRDGYDVARLPGPAADFAIVKAGRTSLVAGKRWKAASTGVLPLRDLQRAADAQEAGACVYIAAGGLTDNARLFASQNGIRVIQGIELAQMLRGAVRGKSGRPGG